MTKLTVLFSAMCFFCGYVMTNPIGQHHDPCHQRIRRSTGNNLEIDIVRDIVSKLGWLKSKSNELANYYINNDRIQLMAARGLRSNPLCASMLDITFTDIPHEFNEDIIMVVLESTFQKLNVFDKILQQVINEERETLDSSPEEFVTALTRYRRKLRDLRCEISSVVTESLETRDIEPTVFAVENVSGRYMRDFCIFNQAKNFYQRLYHFYHQMQNNLQ